MIMKYLVISTHMSHRHKQLLDALGLWQVRVYFMHMKEADLLSLNMSS